MLKWFLALLQRRPSQDNGTSIDDLCIETAEPVFEPGGRSELETAVLEVTRCSRKRREASEEFRDAMEIAQSDTGKFQSGKDIVLNGTEFDAVAQESEREHSPEA